jgi:hypothetical protein
VKPLYGRRKRDTEIVQAEARGESLWTEAFTATTRNRLRVILDLWARQIGDWNQQEGATFINLRVKYELGLHFLNQYDNEPDWYDLISGYTYSTVEDETFVSLLEALIERLIVYQADEAEPSIKQINNILYEERVAFELVGDQMVPKASQELHAEVIAPTLRLLSGRGGWDKVEAAYQDALDEIGDDKPADGITDAARALQETLVLRGCKGNALGPLMKDAKKKGLLGPHDSALADGLVKLIDWVSADRSELGEAHQGGTDLREDAWLTVHVVGALILRLSGEPRTRG